MRWSRPVWTRSTSTPRKAWLQGLSPKENRTLPPLHYHRVYRLARRLSPLPVMINGGIETLGGCRRRTSSMLEA